MSQLAAATYVGQVERDPDGVLWAVLYCGDLLVSRERVRSLRKGKRRVADLVLSASDTHAAPYRTSPVHTSRLVEKRNATVRHRPVTRAMDSDRDVPASARAAMAARPLLAP